jgi:hypothetical protein
MATPTAIDPRKLSPSSDLAKRLKAHVDYLASPALQGRKPGTPGHRLAAAYISEQFRSMGLTALPSLGGYGQLVSAALGDNLIGMRAADASSLGTAPWLLVGAHYDHLGGKYLGADDNASAVAILLETASRLVHLRYHHVLFVAFTAEEPPYIRTPLMGSQYFIDHLPVEVGSPSALHAVIIMDLMGGVHWQATERILFAAGAEKSPELYQRLKDSQVSVQPSALSIVPVGMHLVEEIPFIGQVPVSDYDAFRNRQVPHVFLSTGRTPRYHQPTDLPDTLHYERMAATVHWLDRLLDRLEEDELRYRFVPERIEFRDEVQALRPLIRQASESETMIPGTSALSLHKLREDRDWLDELDSSSPTAEDIKRLERATLRIQCLLTDLPICFLL